MLITEQEYIENKGKVEQEYLDLAHEMTKQLFLSLEYKCKEFDSEEMMGLWLKKNIEMLTQSIWDKLIEDFYASTPEKAIKDAFEWCVVNNLINE